MKNILYLYDIVGIQKWEYIKKYIKLWGLKTGGYETNLIFICNSGNSNVGQYKANFIYEIVVIQNWGIHKWVYFTKHKFFH